MFNEIFEKINKYNNIVIVRHIGADPDALCSQLALRDSIRLTYPNKKVLCYGSISSRFGYLPRLDKFEDIGDVLLIVVDTPDKKELIFLGIFKYLIQLKLIIIRLLKNFVN